jgi:hypothetical protein
VSINGCKEHNKDISYFLLELAKNICPRDLFFSNIGITATLSIKIDRSSELFQWLFITIVLVVKECV